MKIEMLNDVDFLISNLLRINVVMIVAYSSLRVTFLLVFFCHICGIRGCVLDILVTTVFMSKTQDFECDVTRYVGDGMLLIADYY